MIETERNEIAILCSAPSLTKDNLRVPVDIGGRANDLLNWRNLLVAVSNRTDLLKLIEIGPVTELGDERLVRVRKRPAERGLGHADIVGGGIWIHLVRSVAQQAEDLCDIHARSVLRSVALWMNVDADGNGLGAWLKQEPPPDAIRSQRKRRELHLLVVRWPR